MLFVETDISGAYLIELEKLADDRGFFARAWSDEVFAARGLTARFVQANISYSEHRGTLRGLHYQRPPHEEAKLVRCTRGMIFDVIVDLRPTSASYLKWTGVELSDENRRMLYVPAGCAHGYQTLVDGTEIFYPVSAHYEPSAEHGVRYNDPAFEITWPLPVALISIKDQRWDDYEVVPVLPHGGELAG